jgi:predicted methyltransferase
MIENAKGGRQLNCQINMQVLLTKQTSEVINKMIEDELRLLAVHEELDKMLMEGWGCNLNFSEALIEQTKTICGFKTKQEARRFLVIFGMLSEIQDIFRNNEEDLDRNLNTLYENCKEYSKKEIYENPFIQNIKFNEFKHGKYILDYNSVKKGEVFLHDNEFIDELFYVPSFGYCKSDFLHPCIRIENVIHHFVAPEVINKYESIIEKANGNLLCLGLGIGYFPYMASLKDDVKEITIVEKDQDLIDIFNLKILPQFEYKGKINIIKADPIVYIHKLKENNYDYCVVDISANPCESLKNYIRLKKEERIHNDIKFLYYDEIRILLEIREFVMMEILCDITGTSEYNDALYDERLHAKLSGLYKDTFLLNVSDIKKVTNLNNVRETILNNA